MQFTETAMGARFIQGTVPALSENIKELAEEIKKENDRVQYAVRLTNMDCEMRINKELENPGTRVEHLSNLGSWTLVIFSKPKA